MSRRSRAEWTKLVGEWRESGLSAKAFAKRRRIRDKALQWWSSKLKRDGDPVFARPIEFIEIAHRAGATDAQFEIHLTNGRRVVVPAEFDANALRRLLEVVEASR